MSGKFGLRIRRGVTGTAVAATAMAALTASQAPGVVAPAAKVTPLSGSSTSGATPYYTALPPLMTPGKPGPSADLSASGSRVIGGAAIPATVLDAYRKAEAALAQSNPGCNLPWQLLAAIGQVESGQAWGGRVTADGTTRSPILGPQLNGNGFANISDTDNGVYDGDATYDRAVGPMQFIPSTWATWGTDGNADGKNDPSNIYDAAFAAGRYLCAGGRDLSNSNDLDRAILGYNHSAEYLRTVKSWFEYFKSGHHEVPNSTETGPYPLPDSASGYSTPSTSPSPSKSRSPKPSGSSPSKHNPKPSPTPAPRPTPAPNPSKGQPGGEPDAPPVTVPDIGSKLPGAVRNLVLQPRLEGMVDTVSGLVAPTHKAVSASREVPLLPGA